MVTTTGKSTFRARWMLPGYTALALAASSGIAGAAPCDQIVVFGTSLSDPGNAFVLNGGTNVPPDYSVDPFLIPDKPYARGGHHFSNGATWIEQFAASVGMAASTQPAFRAANLGATNFAVAGARANDDGRNVNLSDQVEAFLEQCDGVASSDALYVVEMGANDIRDALVVFAGGGNGAGVIQNALLSIATHISLLHAKGARHFLVANAPNIGLTPAIRRLDVLTPGAAQLVHQLTIGFNSGLSAVLGQLSVLPGIQIRWLDRYQTLNQIVNDPVAFGLANVTAACITPDEAPFVCDQPDQFLFWDGLHPTRAAHTIVAQQTAVVVTQ